MIVRATIRVARAPMLSGVSYPRQRTGLEVLWAVLPALALAALLAFTWRAIQAPRDQLVAPAEETSRELTDR